MRDDRREEESLRFAWAVVDQMRGSAFWLRSDGRIVRVNRAACERLGYSPDELLALGIASVIPDCTPADWEEHWQRLRTEGDLVFESLHRTKSGEVFPVEVHARLVSFADGQYACRIAREITERRRAKQEVQGLLAELDQRVLERTAALAEATAYNRSLIEASVDPLVTIGRDGRILDVNEATLRATGVPREVLVGSEFSDYFTEPEKAREGCSRVFREGSVRDYELQLRHRDGSTTAVEYNASLYRDSRGQVVGAFAAARDVTDRRRSEEALLRTKEKYRRIIDGVEEGIWQVDGDLKTTFVNRRMAEMLGYSPEEMLGQPPWAFIPEENRAEAQEKLERAKQGITESYERRFRRKDGSEIWTSLTGNPLHLEDGTYAGSIAIVADVTERRQTALFREMGREILRIFNEPGDLGDSVRRVVEVLKRLTGFDAVGIRLQAGEDFPYLHQEGFPADFLQVENSLVERGPDGGVCRDELGNVRLECTCGLILSGLADPSNPLFTPGGSCWTNDSFPFLDVPPADDPRFHPRNRCIHEGYASVALVPIRNEARVLGLIQLNDRRKGRFSLDTIELLEEAAAFLGAALMRKRAEEELRRLQAELERHVKERTADFVEANRELESFSYSVSHELRTPLRAIDGFSALIVRAHAGLLDDEGRRLLGEVRWNAQRMARLIDDLLVFSGAGRTEISFGRVDMKGSARSAFARVVPDSGSRLRISFSVADLPEATGDPELLRQVWEHLLSNAVKFSSTRETPEIRVEGSAEGGELVYRVRDNGVGFDTKYVGKLFGIFQRLHGVTEFEGTGVGLALVRRIVVRHGGRAWAEGEPGRGATFSFALPARGRSDVSSSWRKLAPEDGTAEPNGRRTH